MTLRHAVFALTLLATAPAFHVALAQPRPNIVVLFSDDGGYADFGFMNQFSGQTSEFKTPHLDALAQQSVKFSNGYVSASVCSASRAGLLTGRYQERFGTEYNYSNANSTLDGLPVNELLITEAMKQAGYTTGVVGKWHIGAHVTKQPQNQGVDEFYGILEGGRPYFGSAGATVRRNTSVVNWTDSMVEPSFNDIPEDPANGRYFTDALGDEASRFIATKANQANPFFLYVPFTAPHSPYDVHKASDVAEFNSTSLTGLRKNVAASTYAMDRAIGEILHRLDDPNDDGNTSDSIANNTIVVFANDNGGVGPSDPLLQGQMVHSNAPLRDFKGSGFEGGFRVPFMIRAPGLAPGVFDETVSTLDLFPTFMAAADQPIPQNLDGKDLMPYLEGAQTGAVHEQLFWRGGVNQWAMRQGDWKLTKPIISANINLYHLNPDGSGEDVNHKTLNPTVYNQMLHDFVDWEATLSKGSSTTAAVYTGNRFDVFRFRDDAATNATWRDASIWRNDGDSSQIATMGRDDSYANAVLVFYPRADADFTSFNNISRPTGLYYAHLDLGVPNTPGVNQFMMSELRFDGQFAGAANRSGTLSGAPLLFVKNLAGQTPRINLNSADLSANSFTFNVNMDIELQTDLEIIGDSALSYALRGQIRDWDEAKSITKNGTSSITFAGNNIYAGATIVNQGTIRIEGASAALAKTSMVQIGSQGTVALASGLIHTPSLSIAPGGAFSFTGGILETAQVTGNLTNSGGIFRPGLSPASVSISGSYAQTAGTLAVEIGGLTAGTQFDKLVVGTTVALNGALQVSLINAGGGMFTPAIGNSFDIITAGNGVTGTFTSLSAPTLPVGRRWAIAYNPNSVTLQVVSNLTADFDGNNRINELDLNVWRTSLGVNALGDADGDGDTDGFDFLKWQRERGLHLFPASLASVVPEPDMTLLAGVAVVAAGLSRRQRAGGRFGDVLN